MSNLSDIRTRTSSRRLPFATPHQTPRETHQHRMENIQTGNDVRRETQENDGYVVV